MTPAPLRTSASPPLSLIRPPTQTLTSTREPSQEGSMNGNRTVFRSGSSPPCFWLWEPARRSRGPAGTLTELQKRLSDHVTQPRFAAALWGVKVVSRDTGKVLFEHNSQKLFSPASNSKLYTVALALDRLGADYRIRTSLYSASKPDASGRLAGDLIVYGRGDPCINARLHNGDIYPALEPLVSALTNAGVKSIAGDLIGDESYFRGPPFWIGLGVG